MEITAAVVREKFGAFTIDRLELTDPRPDEALVRIVASGMCQTDLHGRDGYYNTPYPAVYGHEGAGVVQAVGNSVTKFAPAITSSSRFRGAASARIADVTCSPIA